MNLRILHPFYKNFWVFYLGLRYLKSKKNSKFLSFITVISLLGVGLGVTALIVVLSVMDGFEVELKKRLMSSQHHILIQPTDKTPGFYASKVAESTLRRDHWDPWAQSQIEAFWPVLATEAILKTSRKVMGISLQGLSLEHLSQTIQSFSMDPGNVHEVQFSKQEGLWIGQELAWEMGLIPGASVTLISPIQASGPLGQVPRWKKFLVLGIYQTGHPEQELHVVYTLQRSVASFLKLPQSVSPWVTQWEVMVKDFEKAAQVSSLIQNSETTFKVQNWQQLNAHLLASLRLERWCMFIVLAFIVIVASFNIVTTLTLMVLEKSKEIAILKAMGATSFQVGSIFLSEGFWIAWIGVSSGCIMGFLICYILQQGKWITLPDIYYDRMLPVTFNIGYYAVVVICAWMIILLACWYPALRAARLHPLQMIRRHGKVESMR